MLKSSIAILIPIALFLTLLSLFTGLIGMLLGNDFNKKHANAIMRARVISQGTTVLLLIAYFLVP